MQSNSEGTAAISQMQQRSMMVRAELQRQKGLRIKFLKELVEGGAKGKAYSDAVVVYDKEHKQQLEELTI